MKPMFEEWMRALYPRDWMRMAIWETMRGGVVHEFEAVEVEA